MNKRGHGEGTIGKRPDGTYYASLMVGYQKDGKPLRKWVYGKTRKEVQAKLDQLKELKKRGVTTDLTLAGLMDRWLDFKASQVRPATLESYRMLLDQYVKPEIGDIRLDKLTALNLQEFYSKLPSLSQQKKGKERKPLSARTCKYVHTLIKGILDQAVRWDLLWRNVADQVMPPKAEKKDVEFWDAEEAMRFLEACKSHRLYPLFYLAITTGLRRSELLGVRWEDIDFARGWLKIRHAVKQGMRGVPTEVSRPKTRAGERTIALGEDMLDLLRQVPRDPSGWVFASEAGTPIEPRNLNRVFYDLIQKAGVRKIRLHDLRHSYASLAIRRGIPVKTLAERLGHTDVSFTLNTYAHVYDEQRRAAGLSLADLVQEPVQQSVQQSPQKTDENPEKSEEAKSKKRFFGQ